MKIGVGVDDFYKITSEKAAFVDKTLLIKEIIDDGAEAVLFTRPRRWGKTLAMSMLEHFFSPFVMRRKTQGLFDSYQIAKVDGGKYMEYQGKYPVIFISFKGVEENNYEQTYNKIQLLLKRAYNQFSRELLTSDKLSFLNKEHFKKMLEQKEIDLAFLEESLKILSECLYEHYDTPVYILIDEYDKPLNSAYGKEYFEQVNSLMRNLLSAALKSNPALKKGIMTGVLRISKGNMLSGLNNLNEISLLDSKYATYFGFTEEEAQGLLKEARLMEQLDGIKRYYNGYKVGDITLYNPWSIMRCLNEGGVIKPYWTDTTDDTFVDISFYQASSSIKDQLIALMRDEMVVVAVNTNLTFEKLTEDEVSFWSMLIFTGYLAVEKTEFKENDNLYNCIVRIPNREVRGLYNSFMKKWFTSLLPKNFKYDLFVKKLLQADVESFCEDLGNYLLRAVSIYDVAKRQESFYHGFVLALLAGLEETHMITSNRESGLGRYDVMIIPRDIKQGTLGVILEFKRVRANEDVEKIAELALKQIDENKYETELTKYPHITQVLKIGMAFSGKSVRGAYKQESLTKKEKVDISLSQEITYSNIYDYDDISQDEDFNRIHGSFKRRIADTSFEEESGQEIESPTMKSPSTKKLKSFFNPSPSPG